MTQANEVREAVELGVDAIGMILHADSPRLIDLNIAKLIRKEVPAFVSLVGVFVDADADKINHCISSIGLDLVQLHGSESDQFGDALCAPYIKAIRAQTLKQVNADLSRYPNARALLLDPYVKGQHGGTGKRLLPDLWPKSKDKKMVLAGGLSAQNIAQSCEQFSPFAVDLNSGIESKPGHKDREKLIAALRAIGR